MYMWWLTVFYVVLRFVFVLLKWRLRSYTNWYLILYISCILARTCPCNLKPYKVHVMATKLINWDVSPICHWMFMIWSQNVVTNCTYMNIIKMVNYALTIGWMFRIDNVVFDVILMLLKAMKLMRIPHVELAANVTLCRCELYYEICIRMIAELFRA